MKLIFIRVCSLLLLFVILFTAVACGSGGCSCKTNSRADSGNGLSEGQSDAESDDITDKQSEDQNKDPIEFDPSVPPPDNFFGEELTVFYRNNRVASREWYKETPEDELDEAIANRNNDVKNALGIEITYLPFASSGFDYTEYNSRFSNAIIDDVNSGLCRYDIVSNSINASTRLAIRDYTSNLMDRTLFPHFHFDSEIWNQSLINHTSGTDKLHYVTGYLNLSILDRAAVCRVDKVLYNRYREDSDPENMQDLALAGEWTYEELYRWTSRFYSTTGDGMPIYALIADNSDSDIWEAIPYAFGADFISRESVAIPESRPYLMSPHYYSNYLGRRSFYINGNDRLESAVEKCKNLMYSQGTDNVADGSYFAQGGSVFYMGRMFESYEENNAIRSAENHIDLLPMPKYDVRQEDYITTVDGETSVIFVPDHSKAGRRINGVAVSVFLQKINEETFTDCRGYYFNRIIKPKFFGTTDKDPEFNVTKTVNIFDMIVHSIKIDNVTLYGNQLNGFNKLWSEVTAEGVDRTFEEAFGERESIFDEALDRIDVWLGFE